MSIGTWRQGIFAFWLVVGLANAALGADSQNFTVDDLVQKMAATLNGARAISVHVEKTFDDILVTGPKLQYSGAFDIQMRRPDRLYVSYGDDLSAKELWYNGTSLTVLDARAAVYGKLPAGSTIDATLDAVAEKYDVRMPLGELFSSDFYKVFTENVDDRMYIGLHDVDGELAHHVWFSGRVTDWQLWIDAGDVPLPLKLVVNFVNEPGEPQATYVFSDWNLDAKLSDEIFEPAIPDSAAFAEFLPRKRD